MALTPPGYAVKVMTMNIFAYTDGACLGNPGPGGWAAIILDDAGKRHALKGGEKATTNNRMEQTAVVKALESTPPGATVKIITDSQYVIRTMTEGWKRNANLDLWQKLDELAAQRTVAWEWVQGHNGHPLNEEADSIANKEAHQQAGHHLSKLTLENRGTLSHLDAQGRARMVDVTAKPNTQREAIARGRISMERATLELIKGGKVEKGDVITVARVAGIMAAKRTHDLIPMCHPLALTHVSVDIDYDNASPALDITATVRTTDKTGVEMEALTAVSIAALTVYDMCKAVDRAMRIGDVRLVRKSGGKSGTIELE